MRTGCFWGEEGFLPELRILCVVGMDHTYLSNNLVLSVRLVRAAMIVSQSPSCISQSTILVAYEFLSHRNKTGYLETCDGSTIPKHETYRQVAVIFRQWLVAKGGVPGSCRPVLPHSSLWDSFHSSLDTTKRDLIAPMVSVSLMESHKLCCIPVCFYSLAHCSPSSAG